MRVTGSRGRGEDMKSRWKVAAAARFAALLFTTLFTAALLTGTIAFAQAAPVVTPASDTTANVASNSSAVASQGGPTYVIGPDDSLHIAVWREPDLTATL